MKKFVIVLVLVVIGLCACICFASCSSNASVQETADLINVVDVVSGTITHMESVKANHFVYVEAAGNGYRVDVSTQEFALLKEGDEISVQIPNATNKFLGYSNTELVNPPEENASYVRSILTDGKKVFAVVVSDEGEYTVQVCKNHMLRINETVTLKNKNGKMVVDDYEPGVDVVENVVGIVCGIICLMIIGIILLIVFYLG